MSINGLTNDELRRRMDFKQQAVTKDLVAANPPARAFTEVAIRDNAVSGTINALVKYIPTEVVTLYVAAASATPALTATLPFIDARLTYWAFALFTPVFLLLLYASKRASNNLPPLPPLRQLPWWKMIAATVAYLVWALAVPGNPYVPSEAAAVIAGFGAVAISTVLSLLEPIFERSQSTPTIPSPTPTPPPVPPGG
jgi:hypothetical protein